MDPVPRSSLNFLDGLRAFGSGVSFIVTTPRVWIFAFVPAVMLLLVLVVVSVLLTWGGLHAQTALLGEPQSTWGRVLGWILSAFLVLISLLLSLLVALTIAQPLSCFALEAISHAQEKELTGKAPPTASKLASMISTAKAVALALAVGIPILTILFLVNFFFPPAAIVTVPLKFLVCSWLLAWDFIDYPMGLRGMSLRARLGWVARNLDAFSAFGMAWALLVFIPGVVLLVLPMGVAGATRMLVEYESKQEQPAVVVEEEKQVLTSDS
jgi:CysZ protein